ncbi:MAG: Do family serine endopeptidase [Gammaproteobacteria bacterium]|nr:Do family serine endopeptidase [Gammaproteobacteria bacterium]
MRQPVRCFPSTWLWLGIFLLAPALANARDLPDFVTLVRKHEVEVVNISTVYQPKGVRPPSLMQEQEEDNEDPNDGFRGGPSSDGTSLGSGFVISDDGYVITCAHVVEGASEIMVRLADRREYRARLVGADRRSDIALLKINATNLRSVAIGNPTDLAVGDWVLAIGAPFGFESSATSGIVSAKGRSLPSENYVPFLQTDVAINPGNSGGPLFNLKGEVVGVNSQIYSQTGTFMGLSFAIPIDIAVRIAEQLKREGGVHRGWLGVRLQEVTHGLAAAYGLDKPRGALIADILPAGPAAHSELKSGDIVLEYEGRPIALSSELPPLVGLTPPGTVARMKLFRRNQGAVQAAVRVGELREEQLTRVSAVPRTDGNNGQHLGIVLSELTATQRKHHEVQAGVSVDDVLDGPAREAGLHAGDVIVDIDGRPIAGVGGFYRLLAQAKPGAPVVLRVRRGASSVYMALTP